MWRVCEKMSHVDPGCKHLSEISNGPQSESCWSAAQGGVDILNKNKTPWTEWQPQGCSTGWFLYNTTPVNKHDDRTWTKTLKTHKHIPGMSWAWFMKKHDPRTVTAAWVDLRHTFPPKRIPWKLLVHPAICKEVTRWISQSALLQDSVYQVPWDPSLLKQG